MDEDNFVETNKVYAEIEMNPEKSAAERKLAIGNVITGTYSFTSFLGSFPGWGDVTITKALGEVDVDAKIVWTWENDAVVDHNLFYETGEEPTIYSRVALNVNVDEEDAAYIEKNLDLTINDFSGLEPASLTVTYVDEETGEDVTVEDLVIENVTITEDGKLLADISNFEWDKVYTITAVYELVPAQEYAAGAAAADFEVRYKLALGGESRPLLMSVKAPAVDAAPSGEFNFAAGLTAFGLTLRDSKHKGTASLSMSRDLITPAATPGNGVDPLGLRPKLLELISTAEKLQ